MARKPKMSQDERRAYSAQMRADLEAVMDRAYVGMVASEQLWAEVMRTAAVLPDRSPTNVVAIAAQCPGTTRVLSAGDWRKAGRHPAKGSTSLRIWTPIKRRSAEAAEAPEGPGDAQQAPAEGAAEDGPRKVSGYKAGPVFDITQTEGDDYTHPAPAALPAPAVRDVLITQYRETYGEDPETAGGFDFTQHAPDNAARILLYGHAFRRINPADALVPDQHAAEVASAAHVSALMLGIAPGPAVMPPLAGIITGDKKPPVHGAAVRAIETGRAIADAVRPAVESGTRELAMIG
ncbi:hypothetical protein C9F11_20970 [Streptomyces sp. YIM 121038]|uniref:hypothetical protein n=1 Tax=Streptomyces sp. YIM 121038 TaxID=2136401 RepID=UPI0011104899|nr:hypothetical protein [Streptomyces sp. YIM 121038]QCX77826.1 hypothetical protein C9F11_20970 [Streptomyces sp. YIM 121038]